MNNIDLHIHSNHSDGKFSVKELIDMACEKKLEIISLTDHDNVFGVEEALKRGEAAGIRVIPGVELSVMEGDQKFHILGYGIDFKNKKLLSELEVSRRARIEGAKKLVEFFKQLGFYLEYEDILNYAKGESVGRPHVGQALLSKHENKRRLEEEGISNLSDFFNKYFSKGNEIGIFLKYISPRDGINLIHNSGGVAVLAHPICYFCFNPNLDKTSDKQSLVCDYQGLENYLKILIDYELDGIEIFHEGDTGHNRDNVKFLSNLVQKYNVLSTAGSDFHPFQFKNGQDKPLGYYETYGFSIRGLIEKLDEAIKCSRLKVRDLDKTF